MSTSDVVTTSLRVPNRAGDVMAADVRAPRGATRLGVVVICHSFMAFKDWGFFPYVGERLAEAGMVSVTFNFSHNGVTGDGKRITEFDRFAANTFSQEYDDLGAMIDAIDAGALGASADAGRIGLLGHSRGGGMAVLYAADDRRISSLVTWSAIATFERWTQHQKERWRAQGSLPLAKDSTISPLRLGSGLLEDLERNAERFDLRRAASRIACPWLIVHGREDMTVPLKEAAELHAASRGSGASLQVLDHVGHLYHAASREEDGYRTIDGIIATSAQWFQSTLT